MKLWAMPCSATQDRRVMVESSDKMWCTGEGDGKALQYSCLENPMNSMKRQKEVLWWPTRPLKLTTTKKERYPFHHEDWNAKVGSQEIPGVTVKFGLGVQEEAGQTLTEFSQENTLVIANTDSIHRHHQITNTEIRLIIFSTPKDGEAL